MIDKKKILEILLPTPRDAQTANVLLALRLVFGVMMFIHGLGKLVNFSMLCPQFPDPLGIGDTMSLTLSMLAETLGSIAVMLGFMTRAAAAIILVNLVVALVAVHGCDIFGAGELAGRVSPGVSFSRCLFCRFLLQSLIPPFPIFSAVPIRRINSVSDRVALWGQ